MDSQILYEVILGLKINVVDRKIIPHLARIKNDNTHQKFFVKNDQGLNKSPDPAEPGEIMDSNLRLVTRPRKESASTKIAINIK